MQYKHIPSLPLGGLGRSALALVGAEALNSRMTRCQGSITYCEHTVSTTSTTTCMLNTMAMSAQGFKLLPATSDCGMILRETHACRRSHKRSDITSGKRFYIFSQSVEMHRHAKVVSVLVRNTSTTGQLPIDAVNLQVPCSLEIAAQHEGPAVYTSCSCAGRKTCNVSGTSSYQLYLL